MLLPVPARKMLQIRIRGDAQQKRSAQYWVEKDRMDLAARSGSLDLVTVTQAEHTDNLFSQTYHGKLQSPSDMLILIDTFSGTDILVGTACISRDQTSEPRYHWYQATDDQAEQPHPLADPINSLPVDAPSSALDVPEDLERLAAPLLAIERGLPLLSRLLAQ